MKQEAWGVDAVEEHGSAQGRTEIALEGPGRA